MRVVGIDPGLEGAVAVLEAAEGGKVRVVTIIDMPIIGATRSERELDDLSLIKFLRDMGPARAIIERSSPMPNKRTNKQTGEVETNNMGAVSAFKFGFVAGQIRTCVRGCRIPLILVAPVTWKTFFNLRKPNKDATIAMVKEMSRQRAINSFPEAHELLRNKGHHNRAEAVLIGNWGYLNGHQEHHEQDHDDAA
jgi:hypothetical protein